MLLIRTLVVAGLLALVAVSFQMGPVWFAATLFWTGLATTLAWLHWGFALCGFLFVFCPYILLTGVFPVTSSPLLFAVILYPLVAGVVWRYTESEEKPVGYTPFSTESTLRPPTTRGRERLSERSYTMPKPEPRKPVHKTPDGSSLSTSEGKEYPFTTGSYETPTKAACPRCGSTRLKSAGYHDRLECAKCGKIFSR